MPTHASFLYARNIANFLGLLVTDGQLAPDFEDEIVSGTCVVRAGAVVHPATAEVLGIAVATPDRPDPSDVGPEPGPGAVEGTGAQEERS